MRLYYKSLAVKATVNRGSSFKSILQRVADIKASAKRTVKEKVTSASNWWNNRSSKNAGFAGGVNSVVAALAVKNAPTSLGNRSMIGTGPGALTSAPDLGTLVRGLSGVAGVIGGGLIIGGLATTATGAGAAVGVPIILKSAVEVIVSAQILTAVVQGEETKEGRSEPETKETEALEAGSPPADSTPNITLPNQESQRKHIFRDAEGHLPDTPENEQRVLNVANNPDNYLG